MEKEFISVLNKLKRAKQPEEIFGLKSSQEEAEKTYLKLSKLVHPDRQQTDEGKELGETASKRLNELWGLAKLKFAQGIYGNLAVKPQADPIGPPMFKTKKGTYVLVELIREGGTCGIFSAIMQNKENQTIPIIARVPHSPKDNDLMEREVQAIKAMQAKVKKLATDPEGTESARKFLARIPSLTESVKLKDNGGQGHRVVNLFTEPSGLNAGWFNLEEIRAKHPTGINTRQMCFIWNRTLEGLTLAHLSGVVHAAITPNHILIHTESHSGKIIDWTASCLSGKNQSLPYVDERFKNFFPAEILGGRGSPTPSADIYMSAWCMVYLLGGEPGSGDLPSTVEEPIKDFLNRCLQPKIRLRPKNAAVAYEEFRGIAKRVFGSRKFVNLEMSPV